MSRFRLLVSAGTTLDGLRSAGCLAPLGCGALSVLRR